VCACQEVNHEKRVVDFSEEVSRIGVTSQVGRVLLGN
jgi:hypothetical protein